MQNNRYQYGPVLLGWFVTPIAAVALAFLFGFVAEFFNVIFFFAAMLGCGYAIGMVYEKLCGRPGIARILILLVSIPLFAFLSQTCYINNLYNVGQANAYAPDADTAFSMALDNPDLHIQLNLILGMALAFLGGAASSVKEQPKEAADSASSPAIDDATPTIDLTKKND